MSEPNSLSAVMAQLEEAEKAKVEKGLTGRQRRARTVARLAAVQALYQMELAGEGVETVIDEFTRHRFDRDIEGLTLAEADEEWFAGLLRGVVSGQSAIDAAVTKRLASGWKLDRLDATVRALLRAGAWELREKTDVPREIVIDEYVELAKAFFDEAEAKFVNAALDGVARDARD